MLLSALGIVDRIEVGGIGLTSQALGEQEIAGVTVRRLDDLILLTGALDVLKQNHFHDCILLN